MKMEWKILLTLAFPGIIQISEGNLKLGIPLVVLNWVCFYALWPILMPISLGFMLRKDFMLRKEKNDDVKVKEEWQQELTQILTSEHK